MLDSPRDSVHQSPSSSLLPRLAAHATLEAREVGGFSRSNQWRQPYVFAPYEQARLRKSMTEVAGGGNPSFSSSMGFGLGLGSAHISVLQMMLPSLDHIWTLVDYHEIYLLWYHCCYHGPTFRSELESVIAEQEDKTTLDISGLHLQWLALLFSIMAGSLTCTTERRLREWGFSKSEAVKLSMQWYKATITSLNYGEWTSDHSIYSVQAITTLTMSSHPLGHSTELSVLLGAALKIAQALGLDKLHYDAALEKIDKTSSEEQRYRLLRREIGRKLWSQLCMQDWMSLPFAGNQNINPSHFTTTKPSSRDHLTMEYLPETFPTYISYGNYLFEIAKLVVQHHEETLQSTTPFTQYQCVLDYDTKMRDLATRGIPRYFHVTEPVDALWPEWVHWARSSLTVCFAHKIIMIHLTYIRQSFTNPVYSMTRITCTAAAKTILNEAKQAKDLDGPIIWVDKAFCVTAAIILCLDIFHRSESDPELAIHKSLVLECIEQLRQFDSSVVAVRGANLLAKILAERDHVTFSPGWPPQSIDTSEFIKSILTTIDESRGVPGLEAKSSVELFPPQAGFSNEFLFENLLGYSPQESEN